MTLPRLPVTVWAWFLNSILSMLIFSVLLAGCAALLSDRLLGSQFFSATSFLAAQPQNLVRQGSLPVLWERLFWYFAQAEVYVAMLPCFGIITHLVSTFSRKPVWKERLVVLALCGVGLIGFCVWGYHMFATGMNPYAPLVFAVLASSLGVPAAFLLASWLGTLWDARLQLTTAMLFSIGFISLFIAGGLSGIFLDRPLSPGDGSGRHVCHPCGAVFLVSETFWLPAERVARQGALLDDLRRRLSNLHAHALAGTPDAVAVVAGCAAGHAGFRRHFDSRSGHRGNDLHGLGPSFICD
jgi:hypothetical protein